MMHRLGIFGNCQAQAMEGMLAAHPELTNRFEVVPIKPVHEMSEAEKTGLAGVVETLDVFVCQPVSRDYGAIASDYLEGFTRGDTLRFPSMWFSGHIPDAAYFRNEAGAKVGLPEIDYHSRIIAKCFADGRSVNHAVRMFTDPAAIPESVVSRHYDETMGELLRRENECEIKISDLLREKGRAWRGFHVMNHPRGEVLIHAANQILARIGVKPIQQVTDPLAMIRWPVTASVNAALGSDEPHTMAFPGAVITIEMMVEHYYRLYSEDPSLIRVNEALIQDEWLS